VLAALLYNCVGGGVEWVGVDGGAVVGVVDGAKMGQGVEVSEIEG
jgi:hypothetical protein